MHNFCTLFDSNYLSRALVMFHSLEATGENFKLYAVCFDDLSFQILSKLKLANLVVIQLSDFENEELIEVKKLRTAGEYCWTCTPYVIRYVIDTYKLGQVTYLDADLCFYSKPSVLLDELNNSECSVLITEHRYTPRYNQSEITGIYCVQFMTFNATEEGLMVLQWWQERCLEWCYARFEDGKFGDQKYLDDWPTRFKGVHVLQHLGGGVAPWNVQQDKLTSDKGKLYVNELPLVFYHFHSYKYYSDGKHDFASLFHLDTNIVNLIYRHYAQAILKSNEEIYLVAPNFDRGWSIRDSSWKAKARYFRRMLQGVANEYRVV